jgi:hypothetical protein
MYSICPAQPMDTPSEGYTVDQQWKYAKYINKHTWFTFFIEVQRIAKISKIAFIVVGLLVLQALFSKTERTTSVV